jgi:hypothetical protein
MYFDGSAGLATVELPVEAGRPQRQHRPFIGLASGEHQVVVVEGIIWPGATAASITISKQLPFLVSYVPDAERLHPATINVLFPIGAAIRITVPDIVTPALPWRGPNLPSERFALTRIGFEFPVGGAPVDAWIYTAEQSHHRYDMGLIEILAEKIEGVAYRQACKLHIDREAVTLVC